MRPTVSIVFLSSLLVGCAMVPTEFHAIWMQPTPPTDSLPVPAGFKVMPFEAYTNLHRVDASYADTNKHVWHIYVDARSYYFLDGVSNADSSLRHAYTEGVQIDGQQGLIGLKLKHRPY